MSQTYCYIVCYRKVGFKEVIEETYATKEEAVEAFNKYRANKLLTSVFRNW